jgi:hypothetical protein
MNYSTDYLRELIDCQRFKDRQSAHVVAMKRRQFLWEIPVYRIGPVAGLLPVA